MTIAILTTGDEIIQGDTLNTNGHTLAELLSAEGLRVGMHLACRDKEQDMLECLQFLVKQHDIIILTGGLGPTSDDRTRYALAQFLNAPLLEFSEALTHVSDRLTRANLVLNAGNRQQALFPAHATLLPNPNGTAMGCLCVADNKTFILLPGPPRECLPMFRDYVLPGLRAVVHQDKPLLKWRLFGVAEGIISEILDNALAGIDCEIGYRCETPYLEFKVRCSEALVNRVEQIIWPLISSYIIATPERRASESLRLCLEQRKPRMVIIDDVTGGILQTLLQKPSTSPWLQFHPTAEKADWHFHATGLDEFWSDTAAKGSTQLTIDYHSDGMSGRETREIPYFSPLVVHYAAEWLSFRLLHFINQGHEGVA